MKPDIYNKHVLKYEESNRHNFNPVNRAQINGFLPSFMQTVKPEYMKRPEQYSRLKVKDISEKVYSISLGN